MVEVAEEIGIEVSVAGPDSCGAYPVSARAVSIAPITRINETPAMIMAYKPRRELSKFSPSCYVSAGEVVGRSTL